jgi:hypothetical protein
MEAVSIGTVLGGPEPPGAEIYVDEKFLVPHLQRYKWPKATI